MPTYGCSPSQPAATAPPPIQLNELLQPPAQRRLDLLELVQLAARSTSPQLLRRREQLRRCRSRRRSGPSAKKIASSGTDAASVATSWPAQDRSARLGGAVERGSRRPRRRATRPRRPGMLRCQLLVQQRHAARCRWLPISVARRLHQRATSIVDDTGPVGRELSGQVATSLRSARLSAAAGMRIQQRLDRGRPSPAPAGHRSAAYAKQASMSDPPLAGATSSVQMVTPLASRRGEA